eukprot:374035-Pelagomonas_calceolata.AAC.16
MATHRMALNETWHCSCMSLELSSSSSLTQERGCKQGAWITYSNVLCNCPCLHTVLYHCCVTVYCNANTSQGLCGHKATAASDRTTPSVRPHAQAILHHMLPWAQQSLPSKRSLERTECSSGAGMFPLLSAPSPPTTTHLGHFQRGIGFGLKGRNGQRASPS